MLYTIEDTTLTALGDAVRDKVGVGSSVETITINALYQTYLYEAAGSLSGKYKYIIRIYDNIHDRGCQLLIREYVSKKTLYSSQSFLHINNEPMEFISNESQIDIYSSMLSFYKDSCKIDITYIPVDENGNEYKYTPLEMADAINALEVPVVAPIVLIDSQQYGCAGEIASTYIRLFGDKVSTNNITNASYMFQNYQNESIPFELNFSSKGTTRYDNLSYLFNKANNLKTLPKINNCRPGDINQMFTGCYSLREIPDDYFDDFDWSYVETATSAYSGSMTNVYNTCYSLRKPSLQPFKHANKVAYSSYTYFYNGFYACYSLDELVGLPLPYTTTYTSNIFYDTVGSCYRLKNFTFEMNEDGTPKIMPWKSQTIDLTYVGYPRYSGSVPYIINYNSGITADKEVKNDATYAALKDDADWFTQNYDYSRYNHDSAVATINSLPDCSATGTNTIKFRGAAGSKTDGGAINTLTEAEIAVAAAKGWTVSLT